MAMVTTFSLLLVNFGFNACTGRIVLLSYRYKRLLPGMIVRKQFAVISPLDLKIKRVISLTARQMEIKSEAL